jgi:protease stability complex PrcB-like protein
VSGSRRDRRQESRDRNRPPNGSRSGRAVAAAWLLLLLIAMGVQMSAQTQGPRTIEKGDQSNIEDARQVVVRSEAEWTRLWQQHSPDRPRPAIDFSKETVLGVFMGSRPNAGFSTAILSATEGGGALVVRYTETKPAPGALTAQVLTFPYHLAAIPKATTTNVKFDKVDAGK